jgi:hypothetical protein
MEFIHCDRTYDKPKVEALDSANCVQKARTEFRLWCSPHHPVDNKCRFENIFPTCFNKYAVLGIRLHLALKAKGSYFSVDVSIGLANVCKSKKMGLEPC